MSTIFIQIKTKFIFFNCCLSKGSLLALLPLPSKPKPSTRPRLRKKRNAPTAFGGLAHPTSSDSTTSAMESGQVWALNKIMKQIFPPGHWPGELAQPWGGKEMRLFQLKRGDGDVDTIERRLGLISSREGKKIFKGSRWHQIEKLCHQLSFGTMFYSWC